MTRTWITSRAALTLPVIAIVLALANWNIRPERALAWSFVIVVSLVMALVRYLAQRAVRRSSDAAVLRNLTSVTGAVAFGALLMVIPLSVTLAHAYGLVSDRDGAQRAIMALVGLYLAATGNALPRMLPPVSTLQGDAVRIQAFQRLAGWTWVLGGLGFAAAWLVLPLDEAVPVSVAIVAAALIFMIVQLLRLRRPRGGTLPTA